MYSKTIIAILLIISLSCKNSHSQSGGKAIEVNNEDNPAKGPNENPYNEIALIPAPPGFKRPTNNNNTFGIWLEHVRLKKDKTVYLFDGTKKINQSAQFAVLDIPVGNKNLQQCADAVMRLRATYLYDEGKFDLIIFYDNEKREYLFSKPHTHQHFNDYLQTVFGMCGTASLCKQLKKINYQAIKPGDVLIRGGFPGHAVIVVDVVTNMDGVKKYMLAQSYMPAQDIHILINPASSDGSPWYDVTGADIIETPEYTFHSNELKCW